MKQAFQIDRYTVTAELGVGGHGRVYLGHDPKLDREVAIKVVLPELTSDPQIMSRFHREARAIAKLHHPNILELYDYSGVNSDVGYLVVERLRGKNLNDFVELYGPFDPGTAAACAHEICLALKHAHELGIVHRDLKPENIFLEPSGRIVLCDFGIARSFDKDASGTLAGRHTEMMGTPLFMSPEQITDPTGVTGLSDLFSLGAVLYWLVTGKLAFEAKVLVDVMKNIVVAEYPPLLSVRPDAGEAFNAIVERCLQVDPGDRYASAAEAGKALALVMKGHGYTDPRAALGEAVERMAKNPAPMPKPLDRTDKLTKSLLDSSLRTNTGRVDLPQDTVPDAVVSSDATQIATTIATTVATATSVNTAVPLEKGERFAVTPKGGSPKRRAPIVAVVSLGALLGLVALAYGLTRGGSKNGSPPAPAPAPAPIVEPPPTPTPVDIAPPQPIDIPVVPTTPPAPGDDPKPTKKDPPRHEPKGAPSGPAILKVIALPWADVYVDERKVGTTPIFRTLPLASGKHVLKLVNPAFPTLTKAFEVGAGEALELKFDLRSK
ncbi:MAG: serine/threonine protein kinase [Deltaproteobacteria bacterium]|nr:serine/threonine protein kinase [Deltaproteobacteria bacterium]